MTKLLNSRKNNLKSDKVIYIYIYIYICKLTKLLSLLDELHIY